MLPFVFSETAVRSGIDSPAWGSGEDEAALNARIAVLCSAPENADPGIRRARMTACILDNAPVAVSDGDIFGDRIRHCGIGPAFDRAAYLENVPRIQSVLDETGDGSSADLWNGYADFSHTCPDWHRLYRLGLPGLVTELESRAARPGTTQKQKAFCEAGITAVQALRRFAGRLADAFGALPSPASRFAAENLRHVRDRAPETVAEALQLTLLVYTVQTDIENTFVRNLGRMDRTLLALYRHDIGSGAYSRDDLAVIFSFFFMRFTALNHPNNVPLCLGGCDGEGPGGINGLSRFLQEVYASLDIYCPKIQVRVCADTPEDFLLRIMGEIRRGNSSYVLMNDDSVIAGLTALGETPGDAADYIPVGCYEPCSMGRELARTTAGRINLPKAVELALYDGFDPMTGKQLGPHTGTDFADYAGFESAVFGQVRFAADSVIRRCNAFDAIFPQFHPSPLYSAICGSCVESAKDAYDGGGKYLNTSVNHIGIAGAADAMAAVKKAVFDEKRFTLDALRGFLRADWEGADDARLYVRRRCPKYGTGDPEADGIAARLAEYTASCVNGRPNGLGGVFRSGFFSIDWVFGCGKHVGALPDGRHSGEPLSKNLSAVTGMDMKGPTCVVHAAARTKGTFGVNGSILDLVLHPSAVAGDAGLGAMLALAKTFFTEGGEGIQFNVFDAATLRKAQADPGSYRSLQVRVCGWNAYFVTLSPEQQNAFIAEAEAREG